jgi:drug/metabolite transporter (DMT)-like permease
LAAIAGAVLKGVMSRLHSHSNLWPGAAFAFGSALLFGLTAPLSKLLLDRFDPQLLAGVLYLGAGLGLAVVNVGRRAIGLPGAEAPVRRHDLPWLAAVVVAGGLIGPLLLMVGLQWTSAANGSLLLNLEGLATMAIAWLVFRENVDARLFAGAMAILAGAAVLSRNGAGVSLDRGALLIAGACFAWGVDNNLTRKLSSADPVAIVAIKGLAAGSVNCAMALARGAGLPGPEPLAAAATLGFFGVGVSLVLFILALRHLGTARAGAYFSLAPFIGAVAAIVLLREPATPSLLIAGALMGLGVWLHLAERHEHQHDHDPLEHEHGHVHDEHHQHSHGGEVVVEPHSHRHRHQRLVHSHPHYPDLHHRHDHS